MTRAVGHFRPCTTAQHRTTGGFRASRPINPAADGPTPFVVVIGWLPEAWFQPLAIGSVVASLAGVVLFPIAFPTFSTVEAVVVDLVVLAAATWLHWLPSDLAS